MVSEWQHQSCRRIKTHKAERTWRRAHTRTDRQADSQKCSLHAVKMSCDVGAAMDHAAGAASKNHLCTLSPQPPTHTSRGTHKIYSYMYICMNMNKFSCQLSCGENLPEEETWCGCRGNASLAAGVASAGN